MSNTENKSQRVRYAIYVAPVISKNLKVNKGYNSKLQLESCEDYVKSLAHFELLTFLITQRKSIEESEFSKEYIKSLGLGSHEIQGVYNDSKPDGVLIVGRPDLKRLIKNVKAKKIDVVLVQSFDVLCSTQSDFLELSKVLQDHNVELRHINTAKSRFRIKTLQDKAGALGNYDAKVSPAIYSYKAYEEDMVSLASDQHRVLTETCKRYDYHVLPATRISAGEKLQEEITAGLVEKVIQNR
jgi:hypothetical protein